MLVLLFNIYVKIGSQNAISNKCHLHQGVFQETSLKISPSKVISVLFLYLF